MPATLSTRINALPIGLAHKVRLKRDVPRDQIVTFDDVDLVDDLDVVAVRQEQTEKMAPGQERVA